MNLKLKTLVAAMAMVAGSTFTGGAQAALISTDNGLVPGGGTGDGNLFLSVVDTVNRRSFVLNTNMTANQFRANSNTSQLFTNAALTQFLVDAGPGVNNVDAVRWNLAANTNFRPGGDVTNYGILSTATPGTLVDPTTVPPGNIGLEGAIGNSTNYLNAVNRFDGNAVLGADLAVQDYVIVPDGNFAYHNGGSWAGTWGGASTFTTEAAIGTSMDFWFIHTDPNETDFTSLVNQQPGTWKLDFTAGNAALTYTAVVPLPAAVWLLGSGLIGLIGIARRRA